jgi:deoxyhypusine monooxygenase
MGAISAPASIPILRQYASHSNRDVRETCEIALAKIQWDNSEEGMAHWKKENEKAEEGTQCVSPCRCKT